MSDDLVKRLREFERWDPDQKEAADRIEALQDIIARIQHTNLRRDVNAKNRTIEIDRLCKGETK